MSQKNRKEKRAAREARQKAQQEPSWRQWAKENIVSLTIGGAIGLTMLGGGAWQALRPPRKPDAAASQTLSPAEEHWQNIAADIREKIDEGARESARLGKPHTVIFEEAHRQPSCIFAELVGASHCKHYRVIGEVDATGLQNYEKAAAFLEGQRAKMEGLSLGDPEVRAAHALIDKQYDLVPAVTFLNRLLKKDKRPLVTARSRNYTPEDMVSADRVIEAAIEVENDMIRATREGAKRNQLIACGAAHGPILRDIAEQEGAHVTLICPVRMREEEQESENLRVAREKIEQGGELTAQEAFDLWLAERIKRFREDDRTVHIQGLDRYPLEHQTDAVTMFEKIMEKSRARLVTK